MTDQLNGAEIAIIGMAGRFPGAANIGAYWQNLRQGVESIRPYTDDELRAAGVPEALLRDPAYVKAGAPLDDMEMFDAGFFGFAPREAAIMDPQHRHFLEVAWEALEHAGYDPQRFDGSIGVFGGSGMNAYMPYNLLSNPQLMQSLGLFLVRHTGNDKDFLTTRVSYLLDLKGPSVNVQTACSTSLVAAHLAAQALLNGECDMALAGGVTIELPHRQGYLYKEDEILAPDGHCRAFTAQAQGTVFGSGAGVVVLKRLEDALADGDTVHAVIKGSAVNNDGAGKVNYFAPSVDGQAAVIAEALAVAQVEPESVTYVEAHGTGTPIGDPIEVAALTQAFGADARGFCGLGSVKTNIGHLDTAAGVAGLIKVIQALQHCELPPSLYFDAPNPAIDFANSPFCVHNELRPWPAGPTNRRAGISSLGVGGTNAHLVLEEAPSMQPTGASRSWQLLLLSAKTPSALDNNTARLADFLHEHPTTHLADAAYTLQVGRQAFAHRRIVVCQDPAEGADLLTSQDRQRMFSHQHSGAEPQVVFMFPGGGAQYVAMGRDLYAEEPAYREVVDDCLQRLRQFLPVTLKSLMFPPDDTDLDALNQQLEQTSLALPALFITEYALAQLWLSWGVQPAALIGHSVGEYVAACLAGVLSLDDALRLVTLRGQLFETLPEGAMLSVPLAADDLEPLLDMRLSLAAVNAPDLCVVSGEAEAIDALAAQLQAQGVEARRLHIAVAAHSAMLEPILKPFLNTARQIRFQNPTLPFISNVTGTWITPEDATDPVYWTRHLRHTVRFAEGIQTLLTDLKTPLLLEVGPGTTLGSLARLQGGQALASLRHPQADVSDVQFVLTTLGRLWQHGQAIDWTAFYGDEQRRRIPLPTYAFDRQRYWIEPGQAAAGDLTRQADIDDWFYQPRWDLAPLEPLAEHEPLRWLIFLDDHGLGRQLVRQLEQAGHTVSTVMRGSRWQKQRDGAYTLDAQDRAGFFELIRDLSAHDALPQRIVYGWPLTDNEPRRSRLAFFEEKQSQFFDGLLLLAQALGSEVLPHPVRIGVIANGMQRVIGDDLHHPEKAVLMGPCRVIPRELPEVTCQAIDITFQPASVLNPWPYAAPARQMMHELLAPAADAVVAYRDDRRWVQSFAPAPVQAVDETRLRHAGVYLITGGLGGIGQVVAEHLARTVRARLILTSRHGLPNPPQWDSWLATHAETDPVSQRIVQVRRLEELGAEVWVTAADVSKPLQMQALKETILERFGTLHGVFHAAGVIRDSLIVTKTIGDAAQVLDPKVRGTLVLHEVLADLDLDFIVLFSSTSAIVGLAGQVDYAAANAFLDAFAQSHPRTIAINWGMWQNIGMTAARTGTPAAGYDLSQATATGHPLLGQCLVRQEKQIVYEAEYDAQHDWILNEHRLLNGTPLIPGTGYLQIAQAALTFGHDQPAPVVINDLMLVSPLDIRTTRPVRIALTASGTGYRLAITSQREDGWREHAAGHVSFSTMPPPAPVELDCVRARCGPAVPPSQKQAQHLQLGPRWQNALAVHLGQNEALGQLALPKAFVADLETYPAHPALLDSALHLGLPLIPGYDAVDDLYVPLSFKRVRLYQPIPAIIWSHVRLLSDDEMDLVTFDITLLSEQGAVLAEVDDFTVSRVTETRSLIVDQPAMTAASSSASELMQLAQTAGISPTEGMRALDQILAGRYGPQVIASSLRLTQLTRLAERAAQGDAQADAMRLARPATAGDYVEPRTPIERELADLWADLLGLEQVGIQDDFFDLGGHSLIAVRLFARIRQTYGVDFSLATLFDAGTIEQLAERITAAGGLAAADATEQPARPAAPRLPELTNIVAIQPQGSRPPFFCVHGAGGNVLAFKPIADYLGQNQPFYGIQAVGVDGREQPLTSIEAMATRYIQQMRQVQSHGPYYLGGFSMGGEVAFEVACQLAQQGEPVGILVLLDTFNPDRPARLPNPVEGKVKGHAERLARLTVTEKARYVGRWLRMKANRAYLKIGFRVARYTGWSLPYAFVEEYLSEANLKAVYTYAPPPFPGRITLFRASESLASHPLDHPMSWQPLALDGVEMYVVEGTHRIIDEPYVREVAHYLNRSLENAQNAARSHHEQSGHHG